MHVLFQLQEDVWGGTTVETPLLKSGNYSWNADADAAKNYIDRDANGIYIVIKRGE